MSTGHNVEDIGATSLSKALKSNTTLMKLDLGGDDKRKKTHKWHTSSIHSFSFFITSTDNNIGGAGAASLSKALKSNTTLTKLNLGGKDKRKKTQMVSINKSLFSFLFTSTDNNIGNAGATSLSESLKSNITLMKLNLSRDDKRQNSHK